MASHSGSSFTAKQLFTGIFRILRSIELKAMQNNPRISEDLRRVEESISDPNTLQQVNEQDLQNYKAIVEEVLGRKIDTTKIDTSGLED